MCKTQLVKVCIPKWVHMQICCSSRRERRHSAKMDERERESDKTASISYENEICN